MAPRQGKGAFCELWWRMVNWKRPVFCNGLGIQASITVNDYVLCPPNLWSLMNDVPKNRAQGTEQWVLTDIIRALIGKYGEASCWEGWTVAVAAEKRSLATVDSSSVTQLEWSSCDVLCQSPRLLCAEKAETGGWWLFILFVLTASLFICLGSCNKMPQFRWYWGWGTLYFIIVPYTFKINMTTGLFSAEVLKRTSFPLGPPLEVRNIACSWYFFLHPTGQCVTPMALNAS